jgi:predicted RecA/RadA family phage recombinase
MAAEVTFVKGNPEPVDYKPGSAVTAGAVVIVGARALVAHRNIAANEQAALMGFGGIYSGPADGAISAGVAVYWNDTTNKFTVSTNTGANRHFGFVTPDTSAAADGDIIRVQHFPSLAAI